MNCTNLVALDVEYDPVGPASYRGMDSDRTPAMRARCGWSRPGGGTGQRQVHRREETFAEMVRREYPVEARNLELAMLDLEKRMFFSAEGLGHVPDWWFSPQNERTILERAQEMVRIRRDTEGIEIFRTILNATYGSSLLLFQSIV